MALEVEKGNSQCLPSRGLRKAERSEKTGPVLEEDKENIMGLALEGLEDKVNRKQPALDEDKENKAEWALEDKEVKAGPAKNRTGLLLPAASPRRSLSTLLTRLKEKPIHR